MNWPMFAKTLQLFFLFLSALTIVYEVIPRMIRCLRRSDEPVRVRRNRG